MYIYSGIKDCIREKLKVHRHFWCSTSLFLDRFPMSNTINHKASFSVWRACFWLSPWMTLCQHVYWGDNPIKPLQPTTWPIRQTPTSSAVTPSRNSSSLTEDSSTGTRETLTDVTSASLINSKKERKKQKKTRQQLRPNPHWTQRKSFDVACVQYGHPHSHQQVPFACVVFRILCGWGLTTTRDSAALELL